MNGREIGSKIRKLRLRMGMTATQLARRAGISQAHISRLENGKRGLRSETLLSIAKALGVAPVYFFVDEKQNQQGLVLGAKLMEAMREPDFVQVAEGLADAYASRKEAFRALQKVIELL